MAAHEISPLERAALADPVVVAAIAEAKRDRLLRPGEVAALFRVTPKTVQRWGVTGVLPSVVLPSGQRRYRESQVRLFLNSEDN